MSKLVETEVKILVPDLDAMRGRMAESGASFVSQRVYEHNVRYENAEKTLTPNGIVLRLRQDAHTRLTYKAPAVHDSQQDMDVITRFEAEVMVDDFDTMDLILQRLGYHPYVIYEKYRTTYRLGQAEIVLDEMPYGNFVEVEGTPDSIRFALVALGLQDEPRILLSYMDLFEQVKAALGMTAHDLTFAAFRGITVPPEVFISPKE